MGEWWSRRRDRRGKCFFHDEGPSRFSKRALIVAAFLIVPRGQSETKS